MSRSRAEEGMTPEEAQEALFDIMKDTKQEADVTALATRIMQLLEAGADVNAKNDDGMIHYS